MDDELMEHLQMQRHPKDLTEEQLRRWYAKQSCKVDLCLMMLDSLHVRPPRANKMFEELRADAAWFASGASAKDRPKTPTLDRFMRGLRQRRT